MIIPHLNQCLATNVRTPIARELRGTLNQSISICSSAASASIIGVWDLDKSGHANLAKQLDRTAILQSRQYWRDVHGYSPRKARR